MSDEGFPGQGEEDVSCVKKLSQGTDDKENGCKLSPENRQLISVIFHLMMNKSEEETLEEIKKDKYRSLLTIDITADCDTNCGCSSMFEKFIDDDFSKESSMRMILSGECEHVTADSQIITVSVQFIHIAATKNFINVIKYLLEIGKAYVDAITGSHHLTPLFLVSIFEHVDLLRYVIENGADVNLTSGNVTALMASVDRGNATVVNILLSHSDLNMVDQRHQTALKLATINNRWEIVEELIKSGADVNIPDISGRTPIFDAIRFELPDMVEMLIKAGANVDVKTTHGLSPLIFAIEEEAEDICKLLLAAGADPNCKTWDGYPGMRLAATNDSHTFEILHLLLSYGADVNAVDDTLYSALHMAAWEGNIDSVRILLNVGAHHDKRTQDGNTPLTLAVHGNHHDVVELLISKGCNVNNTDADSDRPIHYASFNADLKSVVLLVEAGADPNIQNFCKATPLWDAVYQNATDIVRFLVRKNVDLDVNSRGTNHYSTEDESFTYLYDFPKSPLQVAVLMGHKEILKILIIAGYCVWQEQWLFGFNPDLLEESTQDCLNLCQSLVSVPPSVLHLCKMNLRKTFKSNLEKSVGLFELPRSIVNILLLEGIDKNTGFIELDAYGKIV